MREELKGPIVENVSVAIVCENSDTDATVFNVYLINEREEELEQTIVTSRGYLEKKQNKEKITTTTLRKLLGNIPSHSSHIIEPIMKDVLVLNNEYHVSFWIAGKLYDKKYIFLSETVTPNNFITLPIIAKKGVIVGK